MKKILACVLLSIIISCSNKDEDTQEIKFENGFFIINSGNYSSGESASIYFQHYENEQIEKFYFTDVFSLVNDEKIPGFLLDMSISNNKACILSRDEYDRLIITDKLTMQKEKEIILNSSNAIAAFLTSENVYVVTEDFYLFTININSEEITASKKLDALTGIISDIKMFNDKIYFSTNNAFGKVHVIDLKNNLSLISYNIGPLVNSIIPLEDGIYLSAIKSEFTYDKNELINPAITHGIIKINTTNGNVDQIVSTGFSYPYNLTYDNGLFLFMQSHDRFHPSDTESRILNKTTWELSDPLKNLKPTYNPEEFLQLRNSLIYYLTKDSFHLFDLKTDLLRATVTGSNAKKIVFLD
ncbi:hypothetical protein GSB9_00634 [Flavobacteriaceae bacterium GSB9]|nr:hypothetical protein GSB9_00634 [Flavobacteriaceae bacterium GSB9]